MKYLRLLPLLIFLCGAAAGHAITAQELEAIKAKAPVHPEVAKSGVNAPPQSRDLFRKYVGLVRMITPDNVANARARLLQWVAEDIARQDQIIQSSSPRSSATRHQYYVAEADKKWLLAFGRWCQTLPDRA